MVDIPCKASTAGASRLRRAYHPKVKTGCQTCSYRFFLEVTAPSLAGAFYADFWLAEVPRVCMSDAAIWHAVVSLGSAHEDFAQHGQGSRSTRIHLQAGCNLLRELEGLATKGRTTLNQEQLPEAAQDESWISTVPVSIAPIQSILVTLELQLEALGHGGITESPALLLRNKTLNTWRYYTAPRPSHRPTPDTINQAYCAAESLFSGLILFSQEHAKQLGDLQTGKSGPAGLSMLAARQDAHTRCYKEISKAMDIFQQEVNATQREPHAMLPLHLFQSANRLLLIQDPEEHDLVKRQNDLPALYKSIVDLAEQIMNLDPVKTRRVSYTQHLFLVAHSGIGQSTRRRAVTLLRRPRLEGGWDSLISASLAEAIMDREREAACEYRLELGLDAGTDGGEGKDGQKEEEVDPMFRIFNITFAFTGQREARAVLRTWREKLDDVAGRSRVIRW
ncbi:hypothetical protein IWW34DRAFT_614950 [Fusarium oxysporum f. sp. albedinis]|nr:hypothetical protein IWW34DRAFT_614950 [Fusarium oxysporum f. sp. albedinis]